MSTSLSDEIAGEPRKADKLATGGIAKKLRARRQAIEAGRPELASKAYEAGVWPLPGDEE